jgi:zinc protease
MLRQGTEHIDKQALAEELDGMGAGLSVDVGYGLVAVSIKCLSGDFVRAMEILAELVRRPTFPAEELERLRGQVLTDLKEMEDNTRVVADRTWRELAYPSTHPYSRLVVDTAADIEAADRDELSAFHAAWYGPNQTTLMVVGDVVFDEAAAATDRLFTDWPGVRIERVEASLPASDLPPQQVRERDMAGKTQADVVVGLPTIDRNSPDYYALSFANHILGRMYFMGRFGEKVRDEQGLAYYAYSELHASYGRGTWSVRAGVNPRNLDKALASIHAELTRFLDGGPTEAEQGDGVRSLLGSLPRQLETNEGAAAVMGEIELYDLGLDYLERYPSIVRALTREQVTEAARRWLQPAHLVTAVAGPPPPRPPAPPRPAPGARLRVFNLLGTVNVRLPAGATATVGGIDLLGTFNGRQDAGEGAGLRVWVFNLLGSVNVSR